MEAKQIVKYYNYLKFEKIICSLIGEVDKENYAEGAIELSERLFEKLYLLKLVVIEKLNRRAIKEKCNFKTERTMYKNLAKQCDIYEKYIEIYERKYYSKLCEVKK